MVSQTTKRCRVEKSIEMKFAQREALLSEQRELQMHREQQLEQQRKFDELCKATGLADEGLISRLQEFGFTARNLAALNYAPVAEVSWASGYVTETEERIALGSIFTPDMFVAQEAVDLYMSWLRQRPDASLWALWEEYTRLQLPKRESVVNQQFGKQLLDLATGVALASGGLLDAGNICPTEQKVLDRIAGVYGLSAAGDVSDQKL